MNLRRGFFMLLFILIGGYALVRELRESKEHEIEQARNSIPERILPDFKPDTTPQLLITCPKGAYSLIRKKKPAPAGREWLLLDPPGTVVDPTKLQRILSSLTNLVSRNTILQSEQDGQGDFGLTNPQLAVVFGRSASEKGPGQLAALYVGALHPLSNRRYAKREGDPRVFLIDADFYEALNASLEDLRDRRPLREEIADLQEITLFRWNKDDLRFIRQPGGKGWVVTMPRESFAVDPELLLQRMGRFLNIRVAEFMGDFEQAPEFSGLAKPVLTVRLKSGGEHPIPDRFVDVGEGVGPSGKEVFFRSQDSTLVYKAGYPFHLDLLRSPEYFRERHPFRDRSIDEITALSVRWSDGSSKEWSNAGAEWKEKNFAELREAVHGLEVLNFEPPSAETIHTGKLDRPELELSIRFEPQAPAYRLVFGSRIEKSAEDSAPESSGQAGTGRPQWIGVQLEDGVLRPALLGSAAAEQLAGLINLLRAKNP